MTETNGNGAAPAAQALVHQMMAAHAKVHSYALEELTRIESKIARVKAAIAEQQNRSQQESQIYIETVDAALRVAEKLDEAIDAISRTLEVRVEPPPPDRDHVLR